MNSAHFLVAVDIGNTNIVFGLFRSNELLQTWRMATFLSRTEDEYADFLHGSLLRSEIDPALVKSGIIASVVPSVELQLHRSLKNLLNIQPLFVRPGLKTGLPINYDPPQDVGADRIVNAVAARDFYGTPAIVVDFGTATTFDIISAEGAYDGGLIAPGIQLSVDILHDKAARLPRVDIRKPEQLIGKSTIESIRSGIFYGYLSMVNGLLRRLIDELGKETKVVATGGFAEMIGSETPLIQEIDPDLTLRGLKLIHDKNI